MNEEKRMIESYEVTQAIHIGGGEVILAEDRTAADPYMVCDCSWDNPLSIKEYTNISVSDDYLEVMREFLSRVSSRVGAIMAIRAKHGISHVPLSEADCIKGSRRENYANRLLVIKSACLTPSARTADHQIVLATGGNGCRPDALGTAVFCKNICTGKESRYERYDIAGIIDPAKTPAWAKEKLAAMQKSVEKESLPRQRNKTAMDAR